VNNPTDTAVNMTDVELFFEHVQSEDAPIRKLLPYFDQNYGDLTDSIEDIIATYDRKRYEKLAFFPLIVAGIIIAIHGLRDPDQILPIIEAVIDSQPLESREEHRIHFIGVWRTILLNQRKIEKRWLDAAHRLTKEYYDTATQGYGIAISHTGCYEYFPLAWYSQIWNKWSPHEPVDLVQYFLRRAAAEKNKKNKELIIHILKGFGDPRAPLLEYSAVLEHFTSYITSDDPEIQNVAISTLARLRSKQQEQVDNFLIKADISSQEIIERIKELSYTESSRTITRQFGELIIALLAYTPPQSLFWLFNSVEEALAQSNLHKALSVIFIAYVNSLEQEKQ
jgi:hypothetical protein